MTTLRQAIERDRRLRQVQTNARTLRSHGQRFSEHGTGTAVIYCPTCGAPVVDSRKGRAAHCERSTRCTPFLEPRAQNKSHPNAIEH